MKIGYARVSTQDQNLEMQLDALQKAGCEKIFQEKASGIKSDRPQLAAMQQALRKGDVIYIYKLDRLGRSLKHLLELTSDFEKREIGLVSIHDHMDTTTAQGRLIFNIFASLAEFERDLIRERTDQVWKLRGPVAEKEVGAEDFPRKQKKLLCLPKRYTMNVSLE